LTDLFKLGDGWRSPKLSSGLPPGATLIFDAIEEGSRKYPPLGSFARQNRIERLVANGAWTDSALALVELELPDWQLRRLERDDGEWFCTLSRHLGAPIEFDDNVDGRDALLPLAILQALLEAKQRPVNGQSVPVSSTAPASDSANFVWCENCF
jgi:hypothetical protein